MSHRLLANIFTDGAILQRDLPIKFWGETWPNDEVTVEFANEQKVVNANAKGRWEVGYPAMAAGGPYRLVVNAKGSKREVEDILLGDVWLCAGQSNMEFPMARTKRMFDDEIATANNPLIREYHVPENAVFTGPITEIPASPWLKVEPGSTAKITAVGYFFAKRIQAEIGVPIGLVLTALGGTPIESWMERDSLTRYSDELLKKADQCSVPGYIEETVEYETSIANAWQRDINRYDIGLSEQWFDQSYNDENWQPFNLDRPWDLDADLKEPGVIWFRKEIVLTEAQVSQSADVILGTIADADTVYLNGVKIGETGYRYPPRDYPAVGLRVGKNLLTIRVVVNAGTGEFGYDKNRRLLFADQSTIDLTPDWVYRRSLTCEPAEATTFFRNVATGNYNGMIAPLHQVPIKGVIWYQGESNAGDFGDYAMKMRDLVEDWRERWQLGDFPFIYAQLANWSPKGRIVEWKYIREEQADALRRMENMAMVATYDLGEANDLHPLNKKGVGDRMAGAALRLAYGLDLVASGPVLKSIKQGEEEAENQIIITFEASPSPLMLKHGNLVQGLTLEVGDFAIAVEGVLDIEKNQVIITTEHAKAVRSVGYAQNDDPAAANLYNEAGLPVLPFSYWIDRKRGLCLPMFPIIT